MLAQRLKGVIVPVAAPFAPDRRLDETGYRRLVRSLLERGVHGLVVNGTTGESPTVRWPEVRRMTEIAQEVRSECGGRDVPILVGTGGNDTRAVVLATRRASGLGADGALVVTPYYSRPSAKGVIEHYRRAADAGLPIVAYHIPYRTGVELTPDELAAILDIDNVAGLKDSSGNVRNIIELAGRTDKALLCGDDLYLFASLCCGASGGIAASANVGAERFVSVYEAFTQGHWLEARERFRQLVPLIRLLFAEPNPGPIKSALALEGRIGSDAVRPPMTVASGELRRKLESELHRLGLMTSTFL